MQSYQKKAVETAIKAAAEAKKALSMLSFAFGIDDEAVFAVCEKIYNINGYI